MAATDGGHQQHQMTPTGSFNNAYDHQKALQNYAANMAAASRYWPTGGSTFDPHNSGMYGSMAAAAYSQASVLAAAAGMTAVGNTAGLTSSSTSSTPASSPNSSGSAPISMAALSLAGFHQSVHSTTSGSPKKKAQPVPEDLKDETYWERRKRNNESARRSREARRMKEEQIAMRSVYLEQENLKLVTEVAYMRQEIERLRLVLYQSPHN